MENTLYLECYSGISGDMTVAALLDLGADQDVLLQGLASLQVDGYTISISQTSKCGVVAKKFDVLLEHDHHDHSHPHSHDHNHGHDHIQRNLNDIQEIIINSSITDNSKKIACNIFQVVAEAEAKVHGKTLEEVHFHEVGAIDSIIDIVAVAICLDDLNIKNVIISPIYEGVGHVKCQHGIIPVPVPAVVEIATNYGLSLHITENIGEMITPTGAAIAAACKTMEVLPENSLFKKIGIGAGTKNFSRANILRAFIVETNGDNRRPREVISNPLKDEVKILECNIDDMTGEELGFALEVILEAGALDAYFTPIFMKKNRPAYMFSIICNPDHEDYMKKLIFQYTSTLGIRISHCERNIMDRRFTSFKSSLGEVRLKIAEFEDVRKETIEYEDIRRIAREYKMSANEVYKRIMFEYTREHKN